MRARFRESPPSRVSLRTAFARTLSDDGDRPPGGLRVLSSALNNLNLPQQTATNGGPVVECAQFQDGFTWGPVQTADVKLAGETAASVAIQVIGSPSFSLIPSGCSNSGGTSEDT